MTQPGPPPRRGNGLHAASYAPLADLHPPVAAAVLAALRAAGVAAYVVPSPGARGGYLEVHPPRQPSDRLWVDAAQRSVARQVLAGQLAEDGEGTDRDDARRAEDALFRQIVAGFDQPGGSSVPPWPAAEDLDGPAGRTTTAARPPAPAPVPPEVDEHFVPPPPPPVPRPRGAAAAAWAAAVLGVALLVVPTVAGRHLGAGWALIAVAAVLGGFGTLVYRMRDDRPDDDDPDGGAVV